MPRLHWNVLQVLSLLNEHRHKESPQIIRFVFRPFDQLAVFFDRFSQTCFHARDEKYSAEQRGGKLKKKRQIDVIEAEIENGIAAVTDLMRRNALSWAAAQRRPERRILLANGAPVGMKPGTRMPLFFL